jgi:hypothetical protein
MLNKGATSIKLPLNTLTKSTFKIEEQKNERVGYEWID